MEKLAARVINDDTCFSDNAALSNKDKWGYVITTFECKDCTLFSGIDYEELYIADDPEAIEAACFVADLRSQFLTACLDADPDDGLAHFYYVKNRQWYVRLRERVLLEVVDTKGTRV